PNTPPPTARYPLSLHDALPISKRRSRPTRASPVGNFNEATPSITHRGTRAREIIVRQCPNLLKVGAPLPRRTAVPQHRRHQIRTDRKSTRLNSSHVAISYAVFC